MGVKWSASSGKDPPWPVAQQAPRHEPPAPEGLDAPGHEAVQRIGLMHRRRPRAIRHGAPQRAMLSS